MVTDLGIGLGPKSLKNLISGLSGENQPLPLPLQSKFSIICLGNPDDDVGFKYGKVDAVLQFIVFQLNHFFSRHESLSANVGHLKAKRTTLYPSIVGVPIISRTLHHQDVQGDVRNQLQAIRSCSQHRFIL
jgi:hypothetical protein